MKHFRWVIPLLVITTVSAIGYYFSKTNSSALPEWLGGEREIGVTVAAVRRSSMPATMRVTGELSPGREAIIVSRLAGKVTAVRFNVGDSVPAGIIVANIHSGALAERTLELQAEVDVARKEAEAKKQLVADAEERLAKSRELLQQDLIARRDVTQAETVMITARAQAELARANLAQQEAMLAQVHKLQSLTRLSAPIDGVVTRRWVEPGQTITASGEVLTIADLQTLKFRGKVPDSRIKEVRQGAEVEIQPLPLDGSTIKGNVARLESRWEDGRRITEVEIHIANSEGKVPGTADTAIIALDRQEEVFLIPRSAITSIEGKSYVYKVVSGRAVKQEIGLGNHRGEEIEIRNGLKEGDPVIVDKLNLLKAGSSVRVLATRAAPASK